MQPKDDAILHVLALLRDRFAEGTFEVVDHWPADRTALGLVRPGLDGRLVYVTTSGQPHGRLGVVLEDVGVSGRGMRHTGEHEQVDLDGLTRLVAEHLGVQPSERPPSRPAS